MPAGKQAQATRTLRRSAFDEPGLFDDTDDIPHNTGDLEILRRVDAGNTHLAQGLGAALMEELVYDADGAFLAGTLADYPLPTAAETPAIETVHADTPSPVTLTGAKGIGEGTTMSTPVCIANAVADALGIDGIDLPLRPAKLAAVIRERGL